MTILWQQIFFVNGSPFGRTEWTFKEVDDMDLAKIFADSDLGYAYNEIVLDSNGKPVDFIVIKANKAAETLAGMKGIENKSATKLMPNIRKDNFDWIGFYGNIAINMGNAEFEQYSQNTGKWYRINVFSTQKNFFHILYTDISTYIIEKLHMQKLLRITESFLSSRDYVIDYQELSDLMVEICGAKYGVFHQHNSDGTKFNTRAVSGIGNSIARVKSIIGYDPFFKEWDNDQLHKDLIGNRVICQFDSLIELSGHLIPAPLLKILQNIFGVQKSAVVQIYANDRIIGDFVLFFATGKALEHPELAELFSKLVGLLLTRNMAEQKQFELQKSLQELSAKQSLLLDNIPTQIWYLSDDHTYGAVNQAHADFMGKTKAELEGSSIFNYLPQQTAKTGRQLNKEIFATGKSKHLEDWIPDASGELHLLSITMTPMKDSTGKVEYIVCSAEDTTQTHKAQEALYVAKEKAEQSDRMKSAFLAAMNHELRTPLNHIMGFSQLLPDCSDPQELTESARHIYKSGEALLKMIQDVFDLAMADQQIIRPRTQRIMCFDHFFDNKASLEDIHAASDRDNRISLVFNPDLPVLKQELEIDVSKVNQVLNNLFLNAVKYTIAGSIEFGFDIPAKGRIRYYVKDTGVGIEADKQEIIFDFFRLADNTNTRTYGGVGTGLAISAKLAKIMNGKLWVESSVGKGSTFYLEIPYLAPQDLAAKDDPNADFMPDLSAYTIMLVEDDEASLNISHMLIGKTGAGIVEARNGREALRMIETNPAIDLVLMDIKMPVLDGIQTTRIIRKNFPGVPIIAFTAHAKVGNVEPSEHNIFDAYITKPINKELIYRELVKYLRKKV